MSLSPIQLCAIDPRDQERNLFDVTVYSADGVFVATFACTGEAAAIKLRNAIREHADRLRYASRAQSWGAQS